MKSLNAPVAPSTFGSYSLDGRSRCRGYSQMTEAGSLKRDERRKQRRFLRATLMSTVAIGLKEGCFPVVPQFQIARKNEVLAFVPEVHDPRALVESLSKRVLRSLTVPAGYGSVPTRFNEVTITRKSPTRRTTVETLRVAA